ASVYLENLAAPVRGLLLTLGSAVDPSREQTLASPFVLGVAGLSTLALTDLARRQTALPLLAVGSAVVLLPFLHDQFVPLLKARYVMPLVPLIYVAVAVLLVRGMATRASWARIGVASVSVVLLAGLLASLM